MESASTSATEDTPEHAVGRKHTVLGLSVLVQPSIWAVRQERNDDLNSSPVSLLTCCEEWDLSTTLSTFHEERERERERSERSERSEIREIREIRERENGLGTTGAALPWSPSKWVSCYYERVQTLRQGASTAFAGFNLTFLQHHLTINNS